MNHDNPFNSTSREEEHPFSEPWQAHAFANAVMLHDKGVFSWNEWTKTIGKVIANAGPNDDPENYYRHWMTALETLVAEKNITKGSELSARKDQWDRAAKATPHGSPIVLEADPRAGT